MKRFRLAAASAFALALASPLAAQDAASDGAAEAALVAEMFANAFVAEPLTAEQEARLPAASALIDTMMPEGIYAEMMASMVGPTLDPILGLLSGEEGARLVLSSRLALTPEALEALSGEQALELAQLLDPGFSGRGEVMQSFMRDMMREVAAVIEPGFRAGLARAYAVRFDAGQLADIGAFFATPTGQVYATENFRLNADPQVIAASMQAMPAMMEQIVGMEEDIKAAMVELPGERKLGELAPAERRRMAIVLGVTEGALAGIVLPPAAAQEGAAAEKVETRRRDK